MVTTLIKEKQYEELINNEDLLLTEVWEPMKERELKVAQLSIEEDLIIKLNDATQMICIMTNSKLSKEVLHTISKVSEKGIRIYILANRYESDYDAFLMNKAIVRTNTFVPGMMVLIDPKSNANGYLATFNAIFTDQRESFHHLVSLNGSQLTEAFQYFVWKFWDSLDEHRGKVQAENTTQTSAPFDILPLLDPESFYFNSNKKDYLHEKLTRLIQSAHSSIHVGVSRLNEQFTLLDLLKERTLNDIKVYIYTDFSENHSFIQSLYGSENLYVFAAEALTSYFVISDCQKGLMLSGAPLHSDEVGVEIDAKEAQDFVKKLMSEAHTFWKFHQRTPLKNIASNEVIYEKFDGHMTKQSIESIIEVDHGTIEVNNLKDFLSGSVKPNLTSKGELSRQIIHRWRVSPVYRDSKLKRDSLYEQWEKETNRALKYVSDVTEYAKTVQSEKKNLLSSFFGKFLSNDKSRINEMLPELERITSNLKDQSVRLEVKMNAIETVKAFATQLFEEHSEMNEKHEYFSKKKEWEDEKEKLQLELNQLINEIEEIRLKKVKLEETMMTSTPELDEQEESIKNRIIEIEMVIDEIKSTNRQFFDNYEIEQTVVKICKDLDAKIKNFNRLKNKEKKDYFNKKVKEGIIAPLEKIGKLDVFNEIMDKSKITDSKEIMSYLNKELSTHPSLRFELTEDLEVLGQIKDLESELTSLNQESSEIVRQRNKENQEFTKELTGLEKQIIELEKKIMKLEEKQSTYSGEFVYTPKKGTVNLPFSIDFQTRLPVEELPTTGVLYSNGKKRQLAIVNEQEFVMAEKEAIRLNAELVVEIV